MEAYRLSSRLQENEHEYLIQTASEADTSLVCTTVFVDGIRTEEVKFPHPEEISAEDLLSLVKATHGDKKVELENLLKACRQVVEKGDIDSMFNLASAFFYRRLYREAADLLRGVVGLQPEHHQSYNLLAMTLLALGRAEDAVEMASKAVDFRSEFADYRNNRGEAYLAAGDSVEAAAEFEAAIGINMYYADAYFNLGLARLLEASTNREKADELIGRVEEVMNKAAMVHPDFKHHRHYGEGILAMNNRDYGRALSLFKGIREARRETLRRESAALHKTPWIPDEPLSARAVSDKIRSLRAELKKNPNYLDFQLELARCYLEQARLSWQTGMDEYVQITESHPRLENVTETLETASSVERAMGEAIARSATKDRT
jgi:tetratricopeptide (TPR) repeat protein